MLIFSVTVKRKYTKRKGVAGSPAASPRKRVRSGPSALTPVSDPEPPSLQLPMTTTDLTGIPDLSRILPAQKVSQASLELPREHLSPTYTETTMTRDLLAKRPAIIPCQGTPSSDSRQISRPFSPKNLPSSTILGNLREPFMPERTSSSLGQSQGLSNPVSTIQQALLMSLQRQKPAVHITTASTVTNQIHQLLASMPRNTTPLSTLAPSTSQNTPISPIQSKVPTLVNSLSTALPPSVSHHQAAIVNVASGSSDVKTIEDKQDMDVDETRNKSENLERLELENNERRELERRERLELESRERIEAIQKLQFHDFPLTTVTLSSTQTSSKVTQATILTGKCLETEEQSKPSAIHITVNKSSQSLQMASTFANLTQAISSLSKPVSSPSVIITTARETSGTQTSLSSSSTSASTVSFRPAPEKPIPKPGALSYLGSATITSGPSRQVQEVEESLGKVSSLLESSPVIEKAKTVVTSSESTQSSVSIVHIKPNIVSGAPVSTAGHHVVKSTAHKTPSSVVTSYTPTAKPVLSTIAATRTRRIKTPKQYDL